MLPRRNKESQDSQWKLVLLKERMISTELEAENIPDNIIGIPAHGRRVGGRWSLMSLPTQVIP